MRVVTEKPATPSLAALGPGFENAEIAAVPPRFEDSFVALLKAPSAPAAARTPELSPGLPRSSAAPPEDEIVVEHLTRRFGVFLRRQ